MPPKPKEAAADADEAFWGQDAFADDEEDESFDEDALSDKGEVRCDVSRSLVRRSCADSLCVGRF